MYVQHEKYLGFCGEFGNNSFDFDKQGTHFIVASAIISEEKLSELEQGIEEIRMKYFQKGEIKSSKIGPNYLRKITILKQIAKLDFSVYAVQVRI